jgi:hypothetical protein
VNTGGTTRLEDAHHHSEKPGGGAEAAETGVGATSGLGQSTTGQNTTTSGHHVGRDTAIGAGAGAGAGAVGLAE